MGNIMNTSDLVGAYVGSNQVTSLYMGSQYLWGEEIVVTANTATTLDCFDNMYFEEGIECSAVTISFIKMYNDNPFEGGDWSEAETVGTITCERVEEFGADWDHRWYIASSAVTSAITSAEMYYEGSSWKMRVVSPVLNSACEPDEGYKFKALATTTNGLAAADLYDDNNYDDIHCSNEYLTIDWSNAIWLKVLTVTNLPNISPLTIYGESGGYWVKVTDDNNFEFSHNHYYDMDAMEEIDEISFDNYGNSDFSYQYDNSALTLVVYGVWDDYDGEGNGENVIRMEYNDNISGEETSRNGRLPLRFTGSSETIQFTACNPQCDAVLYLYFTVPSDNNEHTLEVNLGGDTIATLTISYDGISPNYQEEFDADGYYYSSEGLSDVGNGKFLWKVEGPFSGGCIITFDNSTLISGNPTFGGGYTIWYVDVDSDDKKEYPSEDAFYCEFWDGGTWDDINQECIYP